jgi:hypothetical protein
MIQLHFMVVLARVQGVEVLDAEHHRLAVDHELPVPVFQSGFHDPRIAAGPVVAAARDQAHTLAITLKAQAIAVVFDLVQPVVAVSDDGRSGQKSKVLRMRGR